MTTKKIALFGMFRSGTNYTRTVLEWNYNCELVTNVHEWKHGFFPIITERSQKKYEHMDIIYVTKDPFASISSLYKYYMTNGRNIHAAKDWKSFLRNRFIIYDFFQENSPQYRFANVVDFWNSMNWNLSSIAKSNFQTVHVQYNSLLDSPLQHTQEIASTLGLTPKYKSASEFKRPSKITKNMGDRERHSDQDYMTPRMFDRKNYTKRRYYDLFEAEDKNFVLENIDIELAKKLGYLDELILVKKKLS
ncbi:hypothetical protein N9137_02615 [Pseudomonadales bacterium]|nr:hypothetical protein [Pseudomonadales bacterium]